MVLAHCPQYSAGHTYSLLNWIIGFRSLGCDIWIVEQMNSSELVYPEEKKKEEESLNEKFWFELIEKFNLKNQASLFIDEKCDNEKAFLQFAKEADLFINYSGQFHLLEKLLPCPRRVYLDVDPCFTQIWAVECGSDMNFEGHTDFFSVGCNIHSPDVLIPKTGHLWKPVLPPVSLELWDPLKVEQLKQVKLKHGESNRKKCWTTITHWYGYNELIWENRLYKDKRASFLKMKELPEKCERKENFLVVSDLQPDWGDGDYHAFSEKGWQFCSNKEICKTLDNYQIFIAQSRGEIGVAKEGYVTSRCGWISDRSVTYLALGKPVLLQDTGWTSQFPETQKGFLPFKTAEEAAKQIWECEKDYESHCVAARRLAEKKFNAQVVLPRMLEQLEEPLTL